MPTFEIVILLVIAAAAGFQGWLTHRVWKSHLYEKKQKVWQTQLIWLLPILGAGLVFTILHEDRKEEAKLRRALTMADPRA
jgi:H+/Cl- antiporter ClcA